MVAPSINLPCFSPTKNGITSDTSRFPKSSEASRGNSPGKLSTAIIVMFSGAKGSPSIPFSILYPYRGSEILLDLKYINDPEWERELRELSRTWYEKDAGDGFGNSVALSGDTLAVGAYIEDSSATGVNGDQTDNSAYAAGAVYVFR